jgi:hypothetical protein
VIAHRRLRWTGPTNRAPAAAGLLRADDSPVAVVQLLPDTRGQEAGPACHALASKNGGLLRRVPGALLTAQEQDTSLFCLD